MGGKLTYYFLLQKWVSSTDIFLHTLCNSILRSTSCYAKKVFKKNSISDFPKLQDSTMDKKDVECP